MQRILRTKAHVSILRYKKLSHYRDAFWIYSERKIPPPKKKKKSWSKTTLNALDMTHMDQIHKQAAVVLLTGHFSGVHRYR